MGVLDDVFPRDPNQRKVTVDDLKRGAGKTRFSHVEESIRDLCDAFAIGTGWTLDAHTRKVVIAGARDFEQAIGDRPDLLKAALQYHMEKRIGFSSPRSLITVARNLDQHEGKDYASGMYADFIEH